MGAKWVKLDHACKVPCTGSGPWQGPKWLWLSSPHPLCLGLLFSQSLQQVVFQLDAIAGAGLYLAPSWLGYSIARSLLASLAAEALTSDPSWGGLCQNLRAMTSQLCPKALLSLCAKPSSGRSYRPWPESELLTLRWDCSLPQVPFPSQNLLSPQKISVLSLP